MKRMALLALLVLSAFANTAMAAPSPVRITEFTLGSGDFQPFEITAGPDGNLWFLLSSGVPGRPAMDQSFTTSIDRITPAGQVTKFALPAESHPRSLTAGPDGNMWFKSEGEIGSIAPNGQIARFPGRWGINGEIVSGTDGNLWFPQNRDLAVPPGVPTDRVNRMTTSGQVTAFPLPQSEAGLESIAADRDGNLWFTETFANAIGRITPPGEITEFALPAPHSYPREIALGPEGNLWFVEGQTAKPAIGRITPAGRIARFPLNPDRDRPGPITAGPDGRLWFVDGPALIGRLTPSGRVTRIELPDERRNLTGIAAGPEGDVWYSAAGEPPVEGGGGTQMAHIYNEPGLIGRIAPGPLTVRIATGSVKAAHRNAKVRLACRGGDAIDVCRGRIRISLDAGEGGKATLAGGRYALAVDRRRQTKVPLTDRALALLGRHRRLRARVVVGLGGPDRRVVRQVVLHR